MDGPVGYAMLARLTYPPVPSSNVGDLKQWPMNSTVELTQLLTVYQM